jgi:lysophospholipase L1-like esterase
VCPSQADEAFETAFGQYWDDEAAGRLRKAAARADSRGMRAGVFCKAGDSGLVGYNVLYGLGCRNPRWGDYGWLEPTMSRYRETGLPPGQGPAVQVPSASERRPWNSFSRVSACGASGIIAPHLTRPSSKFRSDLGWKADPDCRPRQSMLDFEIRLIRPRYVFVNVGTNGDNYGHSPERTARQISRLIRAIRRRGPVPVVCTIPPALNHAELTSRWDFARETGDRIRQTVLRAGVPLIDQWRMLADDRLVNHGLIEYDGPYFDGFHVETAGGFRGADALERAVDFRSDALRYGANLLNLICLRTLHALDAALEA